MSDLERERAHVEATAAWVRATARPMTPSQRARGLQALTFRLQQRRRGRWATRLALFAAAAATAGVVLFARGTHRADRPDGALGYQIEGGEIGDGGYVRMFGAGGASLQFSEGTSMRLLPGARGRLGRVDAHGARFAIEQGEAEVKVTPRPGARWLVDAGPFLITVRGTVFHVSWDGAGERLEVAMTKGLVSVTGPVAEGEVAVRGGQRLIVNVHTNEVLLRQLDDTGPAEAPASAGADAGPADRTAGGAHAERQTAPARSAAPVGAHTGSWAAALNAGDFDGVLQDAERRGLARSLARAPATELAALADAARYRRRDDVARRALLAERSRFPRSSRARDAAFLLGRLEETAGGGARAGGAGAIEWYDRYLQEAPLGAYASEALGRKMTATARLQGPGAARELAATYLQRFPNGSYAASARGLLAGP